MADADIKRLHFLMRVVAKELEHLKYSQKQVFKSEFSLALAKTLDEDFELAEKIEAFVSRFCRVQDTLGDKLLPLMLKLLAEPVVAAIDNLDKAEKLGYLESVDDWMEYRQLRNQMVHEYSEDLLVFVTALNASNKAVASFQKVYAALLADVSQRGWM